MPSPHTPDAVPEADRLERQIPAEADLCSGHEHPADLPEADLLEQEIPVFEGTGTGAALDGDRLEPLDDEEWFAEEDDRLTSEAE